MLEFAGGLQEYRGDLVRISIRVWSAILEVAALLSSDVGGDAYRRGSVGHAGLELIVATGFVVTGQTHFIPDTIGSQMFFDAT